MLANIKNIANRFPRNTIYWAAIVFSIAFMASGVSFIRYAGALGQKKTIEYIRNATLQTRFAVDEYIREQGQTLRAATSLIKDRDILLNESLIRMFSDALLETETYLSIGLVDSEGQALWIDMVDDEVHRMDLSRNPLVQQVLQGQDLVSEFQFDLFHGINANFFIIPIRAGDTVRGACFASISEDRLRNVIDHALLAGKGLAHIIDREGTYILRSHNPLRLDSKNGIFGIHPPLDAATVRRVLQDLAEGKSGYLTRDSYGENRIAAYAPLEMNDWYVFYAVPENLVNSGLKFVTNGTVALFTLSMALFVTFVILIWEVNEKGRKKLEVLAFKDPLTGQRNRRKFVIDAEKLLKKHPRANYSLCYSDIKDFKYVNDLFGRNMGDRLLRYWANHLAANTREEEAFGRLASDIFVTLSARTDIQEIAGLFKQTTEHLCSFPALAAYGYKVDLRGGVYIVNDKDGELSVNDMIDRASAAQKSIKEHNDRKLAFYSNELRERKLWETEVESKMRAALENEEFEIYLQPKVDIQNGNRIMGMEALVRWLHPGEGLVSPAKFIPLFEKNGFIVELDRYVLEKACEAYEKCLQSEGWSQLVLSVNVSRLGLFHPDFIEAYTAIKEKYGIPDGHIELEFTESLVFEGDSLFQSTIAELQHRGFLCSLDDFGAGYSSLNVLKALKVDVLKLDRLFFRYGEDADRGRELVRNIISMAKALHMKTVAEGIDEPSHVEHLREMGCDAVQGYVFAKPMTIADFMRFVKEKEYGIHDRGDIELSA